MTGPSETSGGGGSGRRRRIRLPLWAHQLIEYLLAILLVLQSVNVGGAATFIAVTGGLLFLLAATTDASMAAVRWIPPQLHRVLDLGVIAALVLAPIVSGTTEVLAWTLCLLAAAAVAWTNWHTQWSRQTRRAARAGRDPGGAASKPAEASKPAAAPKPAEPAPSEPAAPTKAVSLGESARALGETIDRTTRGASRAAGRIYGRSRARRTESDEKPGDNT